MRTFADRSSSRIRPTVIELVGPQGAGKTTLFETLRAQNPHINPPSMRREKLALLSQLLKHGRQIAPLFVQRNLLDRNFCRLRDLRHLAMFLAANDSLRSSHDGEVVVFSRLSGPLYCLAYLRSRESPLTRSRAFHLWANKWQHTCSRTFDLIVSLDAPDDVLVRRINTRRQTGDWLLGQRYEVAFKAFANHRAIINDMINNFSIPTLKIDTNCQTSSNAAEMVLQAIEEIESNRRQTNNKNKSVSKGCLVQAKL